MDAQCALGDWGGRRTVEEMNGEGGLGDLVAEGEHGVAVQQTLVGEQQLDTRPRGRSSPHRAWTPESKQRLQAQVPAPMRHAAPFSPARCRLFAQALVRVRVVQVQALRLLQTGQSIPVAVLVGAGGHSELLARRPDLDPTPPVDRLFGRFTVYSGLRCCLWFLMRPRTV